VSEVVALTSDAEIGLWRYLLSVDLVGTVTVSEQPLDAALPWALADFRRIERRQRDGLHLRVLDIPRAFEARAYLGSDRLVFEVPDDFLPETGGRFVLDATPAGAQVTTTDEEPELVLRPAAVGSLLLATVPASLLGRSGLIEERAAGALARADELFRWTEPPRTLYHF
jgi:predicted acetyltransferase